MKARTDREAYKGIDPRISAKFGICTYGPNGMVVIEGNKELAHFTAGATPFDNWKLAVIFCEIRKLARVA